MKKLAILCLFLLASSHIGAAQVSGGAGAYGSSRRDDDGLDPVSIERAKRQPTKAETENADGATYVDAAVLMNAKADEYVAVFALSAEGATPATANANMDAMLAQFTASLDKLGVAPTERSVDYIAQNRVYSYDISNAKTDDGDRNTTATEKLSGFEIKKNLSIRFRDIAKVDELVATAANAGVYDLVKVDYIVKDTSAIQERLQGQTMNIIRQKAARYGNGLGLNLGQPVQMAADTPGIYFPINQYDSYVAAEAENVSLRADRSRYAIISARKSRSTYFNPLNGDGFDAVINPVIVEPVVQFTTYIKVKFAAPKKK